MTTNKQVGSKLANSVRQAKVQQTQQAEQAAPAQAKVSTPVAAKPAPAAKKEEPITYLMPSRRVWPD